MIARTTEPSVAYKYDTGLKGLAIGPASRVTWRDLAGNWDYQLGGAPNDAGRLQATNRVVIAEGAGGSIAAFPPRTCFSGRGRAETNLGYTWYRKTVHPRSRSGCSKRSARAFDVYRGNFALYSAPPGTWQRMAGYFFVSAERADAALPAVLAFTEATDSSRCRAIR